MEQQQMPVNKEVGPRDACQAVQSRHIALQATHFPLLRRISITSLLATLVAAALLVLLYRQDQLAEHREIAAQKNEKTGMQLMHLLDDQLDAYVSSTQGLDMQSLQANPDAAAMAAALETIQDLAKLKIFNRSGQNVYSSVKEEIGIPSKHPESLAKALQGVVVNRLEFSAAFPGKAGMLHDRYIANTYMPLSHAGIEIGVLEIYADATPIYQRINSKTADIALIVSGIFAVLYVCLFFFARRADLAIALDSRKLVESEARLRATVKSALDGIISIDEHSRVTGFNPAAEAIFGWRSDEVIGRSMVELLIPARYRSEHESGLSRYLLCNEAHIMNRRIEVYALRRDGTEFPIELTISPSSEGERVVFTAYIRDISERRRIEVELCTSRSFHQSVTDAMGEIGIGLFIVDANYRVRFMNAVMKDWFGDQTSQICYSSLCDISVQCAHCKLDQVICARETVRYAPSFPDGRIFDVIATPIQNPDGTISKLEVIRDVTELRKSEQELRIAAKAFDSQEGIFITNVEGIIQRVNLAFIETTGYSADEVVGKTPSILKSGRHDEKFYQGVRETIARDGHWQGEIWNRRKNGEIYPEWQTISAVRGLDGQVSHFVSVFSDISLRKNSEEQIKILAFYDPLTGLPNRRLLLDRLHQALALSLRNGLQGALMFIDLDDFKSINDTSGHAVGDLLLIEVASRLQGCVRSGDTIARLGGDEFVVLLENLDTNEQVAASQAEMVGEKIREIIGQTYLITDQEGRAYELYSTASIGLTLFRGALKTMDEMLKRADVALYQAKAGGRNTLRFYDHDMQKVVAARVSLEAELRRAVSDQDQFILYYQAQVDSARQLIGAEVLLRWQHPERGMVSPADFIPLAEESGLILPLGFWVLQTACSQLAVWAEQPAMAHLSVAVNISAKQFRLPTFVEEVMTLIDYFKVNTARLKLEITESLLLDNVEEIILKMNALKAAGISFSLDDFGTGYSSLSYLKRLPLHQLKIDQSFVRDILTDPNDAAIAKTIVALAQSMNLAVIAEGVETEQQREFLEQNGCHAFQGYLYSRPVPVAEFERLAAQYA